MGKLNYSARKIDGEKAVQVAIKDLTKRTTSASGLRATSRDPTLEIDVSDKNITDAEFNDFIEALQKCMHFRDEEHPDGAAKITELHLSGNQLTLTSLGKLIEIIAESCADLREIDLSRNRIEIRDQEQKYAWLAFLRAFDDCCVLKKVDFSGNVLGIGGMEMLARAYMQSNLNFAEDEDEDSLENGDDDEEVADDMAALKVNGHKEGSRSKKSPSKAKGKQNGTVASGSTEKTASDMKRYARTRGLRSVPFIALSNTSFTTGAAIHLASIVLIHKEPEKLLAFLPGSRIPTVPNHQGRCNGLFYLPNERMGDLGHKLLDSAETLRQFTATMDPKEEQLHREGKLPHNLQGINLVDLMEQRRQHTKLNFDYNRIAKRAKLEALRTEGVHSCEVWSAALRMITYSRTLLMDGAQRGADEQSESEDDQEAPANNEQAVAESETQAEESPSSEAGPSDAATNMSEQNHAPAAPATGNEDHAAGYHATQQNSSLPSYPVNGPTYQSMAAQPAKSDSQDSFPDTLHGLNQHPAGFFTAQGSQKLYSSFFSEPPAGPFHPGAASFDENFPALGSSNGAGPAAQPPPEEPKDNSPATPPQPPKKGKKSRQRRSGYGRSCSQTSAQPSGACEGTPGPSRTNGTGISQQNGQQQQSQIQSQNRGQNQGQTQSRRDPDRSWFVQFPFRANRAIVAFAADADGILTPAQQDGIVRYATDWRFIEAEMRAQGAEEYQQIWKLIESVGCFTYSCS